MLVEKIVVGELKENCYLLIIKDKCIIVDPGAEAAKIENKIDDLNLKPGPGTGKHPAAFA